MPLQQTLPRNPLTQLQQPDAIIRKRILHLEFKISTSRPNEDAHDLAVHLEAVEEVGEVGELERGGVLAADVEPDQAGRGDGAAEDFGEV